MNVSEVLRHASSLSGKVVIVEGIFVMKIDTGYMVASESDIEKTGAAIGVSVPNLKKLLLSKIPAFAGSQYGYCDEAIITGVLVAERRGEFDLNLTEVEGFVIQRHGERFVGI